MKLGIALVCIGTGIAIERGMMFTLALQRGNETALVVTVISTFLFAFLPLYFGIKRIVKAQKRRTT